MKCRITFLNLSLLIVVALSLHSCAVPKLYQEYQGKHHIIGEPISFTLKGDGTFTAIWCKQTYYGTWERVDNHHLVVDFKGDDCNNLSFMAFCAPSYGKQIVMIKYKRIYVKGSMLTAIE